MELRIDVTAWLRGLGLERYEQAFRDNAIEPDVLPNLTAEDLKDIGVDLVGHRRKLLDAIAALRQAGQTADTTGERRQVTVLFADLAGYTGLSRQLDAERIHALLQQFFDHADRLIQEHGGHVDKHIGDCVMAVFGAPIAHGNEPERAARAALAIQAVMPEVAAHAGLPVGVHIGVAGGQVVASHIGSISRSEYTVTGETVNLASRLAAAAASGETLISDQTRRVLAERLDCADAGELAMKGFAQPVRAWRLRGFRPAVREQRPFVGRRDELRLIRAALAPCRETRHGQTFHVRGEAGIGKTWLIEEIQLASKQAGFACHSALALDFGGGAGRDAISALTRSLLGLEVTSDREATRAAAAGALASGLVTTEAAVFLNDMLDLPQPPELRGVYEAMDGATRSRGQQLVVADMLARMSRRQPMLIIIEDLHWADRPVLTHLARLIVTAAQNPILLVVTSRIEGDPLDPAWRAQAAGTRLTTLDLGPLPPDDARAFAAAMAAGNSAFAERCVERAAGNPLFLEQLLNHAEDSHLTGVPGSVQSLVQARLDRLGAADKAAIQAASVLGQRFAGAALAHLLDRTDYEAQHLVRRLLLRPQEPSGTTFLFAHALIRDAIYDSLLKSRRRALHRRAADWYTGSDPVLRAEHLERAEDPGAALGYVAAARSQAAEYRQDTALRLVERGLALAADGADRFALTCLQGDILHDTGAMPGAGRAYQAALEAAADDRERCLAWIGLAAVKRVTDDLTGAWADLDRAETAAMQQHLATELARIHFLRGNLCFPRSDIEGCLREHGITLELARSTGAAELEAMALGGLGDAEYVRGRMISAHDRFRGCVEVSGRHGFGRIEVANRPMMAFTRWFAGDTRGALADADAAIAAAARVGHRRAEMIGHHAAFFCCHSLMDFGAALDHANAALALARQLGARRFETEALVFQAELHRLAGRRAEALADAQQAVAISRETGTAFFGPVRAWRAGPCDRCRGHSPGSLAGGPGPAPGRCGQP